MSHGGASTTTERTTPAAARPADWIRRRWRQAVAEWLRYSVPNLRMVSAFAVAGFPLYYLIWAYLFPQPYENLGLRLLGAALFVPMLFQQRWPAAWHRWFPAYWFVTTTYALPFFFNYMLWRNDCSLTWSLATLAAVFLLVLIVSNMLMVAVMFLTGTGCAWLLYAWQTGTPGLPEAYLEQLPVYLFAIVAGGIFGYRKELLDQEKFEGVRTVSRSIAHDLRSPLLGIRSGVSGVRRYLPVLIEGYEQAREAGLGVPAIRAAQYRALRPALERMEQQCVASSTALDMLLVNVGRVEIDPGGYTPQSLNACLEAALAQYPFGSERERGLVRWVRGPDCRFQGDAQLTRHLVFNLLKNALHSVAEAGAGEVTLWTERGDQEHRLYLRDTGAGIPAEVLPRIFERFYCAARGRQGTGLGLSFCAELMASYGGGIACRSEYGRFTEFVLRFPGVAEHGR